MRETQTFWNLLKKVILVLTFFYGIHKNLIDQEKIIGKGAENNKLTGPTLRHSALLAILGSRIIAT